jgi:hypothetical protein
MKTVSDVRKHIGMNQVGQLSNSTATIPATKMTAIGIVGTSKTQIGGLMSPGIRFESSFANAKNFA